MRGNVAVEQGSPECFWGAQLYLFEDEATGGTVKSSGFQCLSTCITILPVGMAENGANLLPAIAFFQTPENAGVPHVGTDPSRSDTSREFEIAWVWFLRYPHVPMMAIVARRKPFPQGPYGSMFDQGRLRTSSLGDTGSWSPSLVDMLVTRPSSGFWRFFGGFQGDEQNVDGKRVIELSAFH
jgi:hypothetical protein